MAKPGFIDIGISSQFNRSARRDVNSSEGVNQTKQSVRNNQVISGGGRATSPAVPPLTRPTPPPAPIASDTSAPGNAAANVANAIATRPPAPPSPAVITPPPAPPEPTPPPVIFIPPSIPDVQVQSTFVPEVVSLPTDTTITEGPIASPGPTVSTEVLDVPAPIQSLPLGPIAVEEILEEITDEGGSGGDELEPIPSPPGPIESFPPPPPPPNPVQQQILAEVISEPAVVSPPPPIEEVVEDIIEQTLQTPKDEAPIPVQSTVQIPEPKPSTPVVSPPPPPVKKSTDTPKQSGGYVVKPNGFVKKAPEPPRTTKPKPQAGPGSSTTPAAVSPPKIQAPTDDAGAVVGPQVSEPKPAVGTPGPKFKNSDTIIRPDGVTEVLGPGGVVLEEIGSNGKLISDPIADIGFDPQDPPPSIQALRDEFAEHVESGADEAGEIFYVSEETKEELINDGLGDVGGALTVKDQAERVEQFSKVNPDNLPAGINAIISDLTEKGVIKGDGEVATKQTRGTKKANEKVVKQPDAQAKLTPRDYLATIEEVLDNNRIRVSLSYNDGVNLYKHKGEDEVAKKFKGFRVNYVKNNIERYKTYVKVGNQYYLVTNSKLGINGKQRTIKVKQPLTNDVNAREKFTFVEKRLPNYRDRVRLEPFNEVENNGIFLRLPNLNSVDNPINFQGTNYGTHDSLTSEDKSDARDIERLLVSQSLLDVQPNIDYQKTTTDLNLETDDTGFGNFVHFSNAESRLRNFKGKLELIEGYKTTSASLFEMTGSGSFPAISSEMDSLEEKIQRVKNSFDPFEHYMYFESSSYVSSSDGQFHDTSWPKSNSTSPYTLLDTTNATASIWFDNMISSASTYDQSNMNSLRNSLPEHIYADTQNNVFLEFMDMTGQQFDEIYTYVDKFTDINKRVDKISEGISKDVAREYAKALGLELYSGNDLLILPTYLLGKNADGTDLFETSQEEVTEKIWKRILANLPFFIKAKGTERAIKGLLNCYGIPSTMLRVREYGGPDKGTRVNFEIKRKFTKALDFDSEQFIKSAWTGSNDVTEDGLLPSTIEFRFRTPSSSNQVLLQKDNDFAIALQDNGSTDEYGHLKFQISASGFDQGAYITSSELPFYNDEFWSVMLTRKDTNGNEFSHDNALSQSVYELTTKQYDSTRQKILYTASASLQSHTSSLATDVNNITGSRLNAAFTGSGFVYLGGQNSGFGGQFSGSLMEYRLWGEPLSQSVFDNHVRAPKTYNGNFYSSSYDELLLRLPLDENINLTGSNTALTASNLAHNKNLYNIPNGLITGSAISNFADNSYRSVVDQEKFKVPDVGPRRRNATKIRLEDSSIRTDVAGNGLLFVDQRTEKSSDDFAPIDSNQLGIYFSPVDVVNEDIMYSIADFNFDDFIGDPRDENKFQYKDLTHLRNEYFKRYTNTNNFFDYLRILSFYDKSVFDSVKSLLPARARTDLGILIEPNLLERSKQVVGRGVEFDNRYFENANHFEDGIQVTRFIESGSDNYFNSSGEYTTYNGEINAAFFDTGSALGFLGNPSLVKLNQIDKRSVFGSLYATSSITLGPTDQIFTETLQPNITGSRLSEKNEVEQFFYSSSFSASIGPTLAYSSSFIESEFSSMAESTNLFRAFVQGTLLTRDNTIDGGEPVEITEVAPTVLKTQDSDTSKLKVE